MYVYIKEINLWCKLNLVDVYFCEINMLYIGMIDNDSFSVVIASVLKVNFPVIK